MASYRPRIIASLLLLLAALAIFLLGSLSRPEPADASMIGQRQFLFGPIGAGNGDFLDTSFFNSGALPTPPAVLEFRDTRTGIVEASFSIPSIQPGNGINAGQQFFTSFAFESYVLTLTFALPAKGQAIPRPFPVTAQVLGAFPDSPIWHVMASYRPAE
jgi:hypothetical protein